MRTRCPLCGRTVPDHAQRWCECGQSMDPRCLEMHDDWCPVHGADSWIGAVEL